MHEADAPPFEEVNVFAYPDEGARFLGWSGAKCIARFEDSCMLLMDRDRAIVARFTDTGRRPSLTVTRAGSGFGTVITSRIAFDDPNATVGLGNLPVLEDVGGIDCGVRCRAAFASGSERVLTAVPAVGSVFVRWSGPDADCHTRDRPFCVVRIEGAEQVTATFAAR